MYNIAREALITIILLTVANIVLFLIGSDTHIIGSVFLAYALFDPAEILSTIISVIILAVYFAMYFLSKTKAWAMITSLVLFSLDTVYLVVMAIGANTGMLDDVMVMTSSQRASLTVSVIFELIAHAVVLVCLILGAKNAKAALSQTDVGNLNPFNNANPAMPAAEPYAPTNAQPVAAPTATRNFQMTLVQIGFKQADNGQADQKKLFKNSLNALLKGSLNINGNEVIISGKSIMAGMLIPENEIIRFTANDVVSVTEIPNKGAYGYCVMFRNGNGINLCASKKEKATLAQALSSVGIFVPPAQM